MIKIFISYSHHDEGLRQELDTHLSSLKQQGLIDVWHDRRIIGGSELDPEINKLLSSANIILLLISPDFIASNYCYNVELQAALQKHKNGTATVLPVILRPCDWHDLPFGGLLVSPPDGKPIIKYPSLDDGFQEVVKEIKRIIEKSNQRSLEISSTILNRYKTDIIPSERSSNLRIKRTFSDEDKDKFEFETFEYIAQFFENSLTELQKRNTFTKCIYRKIDSNTFEAIIYIDGQQKSMCKIRLHGNRGFEGITFAFGRDTNSINESLHIENDGYIQYLKAMGLQTYNFKTENKLTMEGAAEYYWNLLIRNLQ